MKKIIAYKVSKKALIDLEQIWIYTYKKWSEKQADRYYQLLISEFEFLTKEFYSGKSMEHIRDGYRATLVKSHLIFYRKTDENIVEIIRILHKSMDIPNRLNE